MHPASNSFRNTKTLFNYKRATLADDLFTIYKFLRNL